MILVIKHVVSEGPGIIEPFFKGKGYETKTLELANNDPFPATFEGIDAVISMGGPMNVYEEDKFPYLREEDYFIREVVRLRIPFIGICLGAQLLAKAFGAPVSKAKEKEIGWHKITLNKSGMEDGLFRGAGKYIDVFQWHGDEFAVPRFGTLLASSEVCPQAFCIGRNAYGLQFHFEVNSDIVRQWADEIMRSGLSNEKDLVPAMLDGIPSRGKQVAAHAEKILSNFHEIISASRSLTSLQRQRP